VAKQVKQEDPSFREETAFRVDLLNVCIAVPWLAALYTTPVLWVTHQFRAATVGAIIVLVLSVVLALTWWPNLPKAEGMATVEPRTLVSGKGKLS
jgi:hypothetical protein